MGENEDFYVAEKADLKFILQVKYRAVQQRGNRQHRRSAKERP